MPFCTQCGHNVASGDAFCGSCGTRQTPAGAGPGTAGSQQTSYTSQPAPDPLAGIHPRTAAILCYIPTIGWIAAVFCLAARRFKHDTAVRFHAFQGLYLFAAWLVVQWVIHPMVLFSRGPMRIDHVLELMLVGVGIFMMVKASHDEVYVLPIIGELAQRSASEQR
jgi:uncharacterized membrane protein